MKYRIQKKISQWLGLYTKKELQLAIEFGVVVAETARGSKIKKYEEVVVRLEEILPKEFSERSTERVALDMIPLIMSAFETNTQD